MLNMWKSSGVNNGPTFNMLDHFQELIREMKMKIAEISEQQKQCYYVNASYI